MRTPGKRKVVLRVDEIKTREGEAFKLNNTSSVICGLFSQVEKKTAVGNINDVQQLLNTNNCLGSITRLGGTSKVGGAIKISAHGDFVAKSGNELSIIFRLGDIILAEAQKLR